MRTWLKIGAAAAALTLGAANASAQTTTLTFDDLAGLYGDGASLGPNMTYDASGRVLTYTTGGYVLTLNSNASYYGGAHIGDGTGVGQTYNWHDGLDNGTPTTVRLSRVGGGSFSLGSFDYTSDEGLLVTSGLLNLALAVGSGSTTGFSNVSFIDFYGIGNNGLDNLVLTAGAVGGAVPEPATWGLMLVGFGAMGYAMRRRAMVRTNVSFA